MTECPHSRTEVTKVRTGRHLIKDGRQCYQPGWYCERYCANTNCLQVMENWHEWESPICDD